MSQIPHMPEPKGTQLGKSTVYSDAFDAGRLQPIPRALGRSTLSIKEFQGTDVWGLYELTWLTPSGLPAVALGRLFVPASTPNIVESKSLKLYLGGFTQTVFESADAVKRQIEKDISAAAGGAVRAELTCADDSVKLTSLRGTLLEERDSLPAVTRYEPEAGILEADTEKGERTWRTNLFRSLCPVTGQPDHASVSVRIRGNGPSPESLLAYLVSFRMHRGFHEQCAEQIFTDIMTRFSPELLEVQAAFTRRGGIDISPFRSTERTEPEDLPRTPRQ